MKEVHRGVSTSSNPVPLPPAATWFLPTTLFPLQIVPVPGMDDLILFDIPTVLAASFAFCECE